MKEDALSRLKRAAGATANNTTYSIDEQLEDTDDDFIGAMSDESRDKMFGAIKMEYREDSDNESEEVEDDDKYTQEQEPEEVQEQQYIEPQYVEPKRGRGRPPKKAEAETTTQPIKQVYSEPQQEEPPRVYRESSPSMDLSSFMDSLAKDLIEELRVSNYSTRNFSHSQMLTILNYIEQKI